jgi:hypothetical protein
MTGHATMQKHQISQFRESRVRSTVWPTWQREEKVRSVSRGRRQKSSRTQAVRHTAVRASRLGPTTVKRSHRVMEFSDSSTRKFYAVTTHWQQARELAGKNAWALRLCLYVKTHYPPQMSIVGHRCQRYKARCVTELSSDKRRDAFQRPASTLGSPSRQSNRLTPSPSCGALRSAGPTVLISSAPRFPQKELIWAVGSKYK